jgi:hypothetical protein
MASKSFTICKYHVHDFITVCFYFFIVFILYILYIGPFFCVYVLVHVYIAKH